MTGLAGQVFGVAVEVMVQKRLALVRFVGVAILAGSASFSHRQGEAAAGNLVVSGFVAVMALQVKASHVDVTAA